MYMVHLLQLMNQYWYIIINWSPYIIQIFLVFPLCPCSVAGSHPGHHIMFSRYVSLGSPWLWQFLRLSLFLMTLTVLRSTGQAFCRECPSVEICLMVFSWLNWGCVFWEEDRRSQVLFLSHHIKGTYINMTYPYWCWPWSSGWGNICQVSYCWLFFSPFSVLYSVEGSHHT